MPKIPLTVIPEPPEGSRAIIIFSGEGTVAMRGSATGHDYVCGECGATILEGVPKGQVSNLVFRCNNCGAFHDTEPPSTPDPSGESQSSNRSEGTMMIPAANTFENQAFRDRSIYIDGNSYTGCIFTNCRIIYTGAGMVGLDSCEFRECVWVFEGPAQNTVGFLRAMYAGMGDVGQAMVNQLFDDIRQTLNPAEGPILSDNDEGAPNG